MLFLIVEDDPLISADLEQIIKGMGHEVLGVADSKSAALDLMASRRPDAVFVDINLRDGYTGVEVAELVRARHGIPVVFLTANAEMVPGRTGSGAGVRVLQKPFSEAHIRTAVASIAEGPRAGS